MNNTHPPNSLLPLSILDTPFNLGKYRCQISIWRRIDPSNGPNSDRSILDRFVSRIDQLIAYQLSVSDIDLSIVDRSILDSRDPSSTNKIYKLRSILHWLLVDNASIFSYPE